MVRKKNKMFVDSADRTPHYSLRKLSVGVASVLLSTTLWMGANGSVAHADTGTVNNDATETVVGKASSGAEDNSDPSETQTASNGQTQTQRGQVQEGSRANAGVQTATANDAHAQAGMTKQEPAAVATKGAKNKLTTRQAFKTPITDTASAGGENELTK